MVADVVGDVRGSIAGGYASPLVQVGRVGGGLAPSRVARSTVGV